MAPLTVLEEFTNTLIALGEEQVRVNLLQHVWNSPRKEWASEWLEFQEKTRASHVASRAEMREEESISIAKRALSVAADANRVASETRDSAAAQARWAMWAAIIATVAAVVAAKDQIVAFFFHQP